MFILEISKTWIFSLLNFTDYSNTKLVTDTTHSALLHTNRNVVTHKQPQNAVYTMVQKNAPTLADYNYDPVQSILIIFSKLFDNDHESCLVVKFSTSPHICCHYTLWNTMLYFALITLLIAKKNAPISDHHNFNKRWRILIMFAMQYGHILRITS